MMKYLFLVVALLVFEAPVSAKISNTNELIAAMQEKYGKSWYKTATFVLSGTGDLIEPDDGIVAVGSGGPFAMAAARALARHSALEAREIAERAMAIAGELCIYTNANVTIEEL